MYEISHVFKKPSWEKIRHAHRDHYGGLDGFISHLRTHMLEDVSLYIGGDGMFCERWIRAPDKSMVSYGTPDRISLISQKVMPACCETPHALHGPFTSGYIKLNSFEEVAGGCMVAPDHFAKEELGGKPALDEHPKEQATY